VGRHASRMGELENAFKILVSFSVWGPVTYLGFSSHNWN